ncbi:MAG TPA: GNAT family N-acetyltransferase [Symbiobacteriaceae bacterium]|nr:GNAT family N-acetyltransferase [Symbiobacteriaceae bacterium]
MFALTQIEPQLYAAFGPDGTLAGRGSRSHLLHGLPVCPGQQFLKIEVQPQFRGRGAGTALYAALERDAKLTGATSLACAVAPGNETSLRFATSRGFRVDYEMLDSELDLAGFDLGRWEGAVPAAEIHGIRFTTLLQPQDEHLLLQNLYELDRDLSRDVPDWSGVMPPLAEYEASLAECEPEAVFIAWAEGRPVGYSMTGADGYTHFMGVARAFRSKGIALALKVLTIRWALSRGVACLRTNNNAANAAILGLNRKLGYTSRLGTIYLVKE